MHLKSYLVDAKVLRDGSANFSSLGESEQDNSMLITDDDPPSPSSRASSRPCGTPGQHSVAQAVRQPTTNELHRPPRTLTRSTAVSADGYPHRLRSGAS